MFVAKFSQSAQQRPDSLSARIEKQQQHCDSPPKKTAQHAHSERLAG